MAVADVVIVLWVLAAHWVGDFVTQDDYTATNKSKNNAVLLNHVVVYTVVLALSFAVPARILGYFGPSVYFPFLLVNAVLHFAVDYVTSRLNSWLWYRRETHYFFVSVGFDQYLHSACLVLTLHYFMR